MVELARKHKELELRTRKSFFDEGWSENGKHTFRRELAGGAYVEIYLRDGKYSLGIRVEDDNDSFDNCAGEFFDTLENAKEYAWRCLGLLLIKKALS